MKEIKIKKKPKPKEKPGSPFDQIADRLVTITSQKVVSPPPKIEECSTQQEETLAASSFSAHRKSTLAVSSFSAQQKETLAVSSCPNSPPPPMPTQKKESSENQEFGSVEEIDSDVPLKLPAEDQHSSEE